MHVIKPHSLLKFATFITFTAQDESLICSWCQLWQLTKLTKNNSLLSTSSRKVSVFTSLNSICLSGRAEHLSHMGSSVGLSQSILPIHSGLLLTSSLIQTLLPCFGGCLVPGEDSSGFDPFHTSGSFSPPTSHCDPLSHCMTLLHINTLKNFVQPVPICSTFSVIFGLRLHILLSHST